MTPVFGKLVVFPDGEALAQGAANFLCEQAEAKQGEFVLSLSGGSTPKRLYEILAAAPLKSRFPWDRTQFVYGDERFVPPDDPASNARMTDIAMFDHVQVPEDHVHALPTVGQSAEQAAAAYESTLQKLYGATALSPGRPMFDVMLLGLGDDGHTASLIPGEPALQERRRWTAVVAHGRLETRITLTYPALESSRHMVFLVQGEAKRAILDRVLSGDDRVPAAKLRPVGEVLWFCDRSAAGRWAE